MSLLTYGLAAGAGAGLAWISMRISSARRRRAALSPRWPTPMSAPLSHVIRQRRGGSA